MNQGWDLRLVTGVLAAWGAALWGLTQPAGIVAVAAVTGLAAAGTLALIGPRRRWVSGLGLVCCTVCLVLSPLAARLHEAHDGQLAALARAGIAVTADLEVSGDPRPLVAHGTSGAPRSAVDAKLLAVVVGGRRTRITGAILVLVATDAWRGILPGQRVRLDGRLAPPLSDNLLSATISVRNNPQLLGRPPPWQRAAGAVRDGLQRASQGLPVLPRGLLPGLVDGDTSQLDPVLANRFRVAGLTHLVAVSGTNLSVLIGAVALVLRRLRASPRTIAVLGGLVLVGFVLIARPSPSVLRAAVMAAIALAALATGRQRTGLPALAAASLVLLIWQPALADNLGFALSVAATAALLVIAPGWVQALHRWGVPTGLAEALAVAAAAHLVTVPIIAGISGRVSLVAVPANLLAEPVVAAATVLGVLAAVCSVLWLPVAAGLAELAGWPCRWLVSVAEYFGSLPGASIPWPSGVSGGLLLGALVAGLLMLCRHRRARVLLLVAAVLGSLIQIPGRAIVTGWPPPGWIMVACDIGQGDALVLNAGGGGAVVVDAGPDPVSVDRCLRQLGVSDVALLVLTHSHLDHVGGLPGVLHERRVGRVVTSPFSEPVTGHRLILKALATRGLPLQQVGAGEGWAVGPIRLTVLGPRRIYQGTRSDPNNSSVVMLATVDGVRILLPGDAELEAQDDLLAAGVDLRADILKVPHHGSAYSDPAFLQAVHAKLALISVGLNNDYGHPSPLLLAELARLGVPTRRTDQDGDIAVIRTGGRFAAVLHSTRSGNAAGPGWACSSGGRGGPSQARATMPRCRPPPPTHPPR